MKKAVGAEKISLFMYILVLHISIVYSCPFSGSPPAGAWAWTPQGPSGTGRPLPDFRMATGFAGFAFAKATILFNVAFDI